jgi:hypothetical protein
MAYVIPGNLNSWFEISKIGTFRWVDNNITSVYNTLPLDSAVDNLSYKQPIQCGGGGYQSDTGQIQLTSNYVPTGGLYDYNTNALITALDFVPIADPILGVTFICYNAAIDFSAVNPGTYYLKINFTDDDEVVHDWRTSPLDVQIWHEGTQLCEATHFSNDKGVVFVNPDLSTLVITHRVASLIQAPLVKSDATDFEDQYNELTQEESVPFSTYTQILGGPLLLPFWVIEKINLLYSLNQTLWDGQPFAKLSNSDFKPTRADTQPQGAFWQVDIQPNYSYPSEQYITGQTGDGGEYIVIKQAKTFKAQTADFAYNGCFTAGINLIRLAVKNTSLNAFTLKVGIAEGDNSFGEFDIEAGQLDNSLDIGKLFMVATNVWISGLEGQTIDVTFDYNNYLAVNTPPPATTAPNWVKNTLYFFEEIVPDSFEVEFNVATGRGNVGTDHEGCVLAGTNGTPARAGMTVKIWNVANATAVPPILDRGTVTGAIIGDTPNLIELEVAQLPAHTHGIKRVPAGQGGTADPTVIAANNSNGSAYNDIQTGPGVGLNGDSIDIENYGVILPGFYYVGV